MSVTPLPAINSDWDAWATDVDRIVRAVDAGTAVGTVDYDSAPSGSFFIVVKNTDGTWPDRPSARTDIVFGWLGTGTDPTVVNSGTGGLLNGVDLRLSF